MVDRKAVLDRELMARAASGWRTESRGEFQATVVKGKRPSHLLHLVLSVLTAGVWLIVWLLVGLLGGEKRRMVTVDDDGGVTVQKI